MKIGKIAIADRLIRCENEGTFDTAGEDWYTYLIARMTDGTPFEEFGSNQVSFVTFNYDRSLEHYLATTLRFRSGKPIQEVAEALKRIPVIHVHGNLGALPWPPSHFGAIQQFVHGKECLRARHAILNFVPQLFLQIFDGQTGRGAKQAVDARPVIRAEEGKAEGRQPLDNPIVGCLQARHALLGNEIIATPGRPEAGRLTRSQRWAVICRLIAAPFPAPGWLT
jgi:hypothetical protein